MSAGDNSYQSVTFLIDLHDALLKQQQQKIVCHVATLSIRSRQSVIVSLCHTKCKSFKLKKQKMICRTPLCV